jgi:glycine betaine transporter
MLIIAALPFSIVMLLMGGSFYKAAKTEFAKGTKRKERKKKKQEQDPEPS